MMTKEQAIINLDEVIAKTEKARLSLDNHHIVQTVAVSKYSTSHDIELLYKAGQRAFGENKIQDLRRKQEELSELPLSWHFIGNLQKNKINNLIDADVDLFHSLDCINLANELDKKLKIKNKIMSCLLEINISKEDNKHGVNLENAINTYDEIKKNCTNINLKGIMCIASNTSDKMKTKEEFSIINNIYKSCENATVCSMGMSDDFDIAIECGSNMIRVGRTLFRN